MLTFIFSVFGVFNFVYLNLFDHLYKHMSFYNTADDVETLNLCSCCT